MPDTEKRRLTKGEKIALSWKDPTIRAARARGISEAWDSGRRARVTGIKKAWAEGKFANSYRGGRPPGMPNTSYNLSPEGLEKKQITGRKACAKLRKEGRSGSGYFKTRPYPDAARAKNRQATVLAITEGRLDPAENARKFVAQGASEAFVDNFGYKNGKCRRGNYYSHKNKKWFRYDSSWELVRMEVLEAADDVVTYRKNPVSIPYKLNGKAHYYWPDFLVEYADGQHVLEEIKPPWALKDTKVRAKMKVARLFCKTQGFQFRVCSSHESLRVV